MFSANVFDAKTLELAEKWTSPQPPRERLRRWVMAPPLRRREITDEDRFDPVPEPIRRDLERLPADELRQPALRIGKAASLDELGLVASRADR